MRFESELPFTFGFISGKTDSIILPNILNGVEKLWSTDYVIEPPEIAQYFSYGVIDWDLGAAEPKIKNSLYYDGSKALESYIGEYIFLTLYLYDDQ